MSLLLLLLPLLLPPFGLLLLLVSFGVLVFESMLSLLVVVVIDSWCRCCCKPVVKAVLGVTVEGVLRKIAVEEATEIKLRSEPCTEPQGAGTLTLNQNDGTTEP